MEDDAGEQSSFVTGLIQNRAKEVLSVCPRENALKQKKILFPFYFFIRRE